MIMLNKIKTLTFYILLISLTILLLSHYNAALNFLLSVSDSYLLTFGYNDYNYSSWGTLLVVGLGVYSQFNIYKLFSLRRGKRIYVYCSLLLATLLLNVFLSFEVGMKIHDIEQFFRGEQELYTLGVALYDIRFWTTFTCGFVVNILWYELLKISIHRHFNAFMLVLYVLLLSILVYNVKDGIWIGVVVYGIVCVLWLLNAMFVSGFRNKYPEDFILHVQHIIDMFTSHGFKIENSQHGGTSQPEVILTHGMAVAKIKLHYPILCGPMLIDVFIEDETDYQWHIPIVTNKDVIDEWLNEYFDSKIEKCCTQESEK